MRMLFAVLLASCCMFASPSFAEPKIGTEFSAEGAVLCSKAADMNEFLVDLYREPRGIVDIESCRRIRSFAGTIQQVQLHNSFYSDTTVVRYYILELSVFAEPGAKTEYTYFRERSLESWR
jgi:hypothetical protein